MTDSDGGRGIPVDSFRIRLAIVRTAMGWNYEQTQAATGIVAESWRLWEKGQRHCTNIKEVSRRIAEVTPYDASWLVMGGPLMPEESDPTASGVRFRRASSRAVTSASSRGCVSSTRRVRREIPGIPSPVSHAA